MKQRIYSAIEAHHEAFTEIAQYIGAHPELGHKEFKAAARLTAALREHGFRVESPFAGLATAFLGTYVSGKPGPIVAFLCEYDALPEIGHACGHHLIGTMSVAAAVGLKAVIDECGGSIRVYGTPAEETKGAKVTMAEAGLFDDVDFALMAHPYHTYEKSGHSLAMDAVQYEFFGKSAHAAANPHDGINALDAVLLLFQSVNALRQQVRSHARIHGIIAEGGKAPNMIPDYTAARFYIRSAERPYTDELVRRVRSCAEGAALATGCRLHVSNYEYSYDELLTNTPLSEQFTRNLTLLGVPEEEIVDGQDHGSLDLGNVSRRCPVIHPFIKVIDEKHGLHTESFRDLAMTPRAMDGMLLGAKALAATALDVLASPALLKVIRRHFEQATAR